MLTDLKAAAQPTDVVAVARFSLDDASHGASDDYVGYDLVIVANLTGQNIATPQIGFVTSPSSTFAQQLSASGIGTLSALNGGQVWATLVPHGTTLYVNASLGAAGSAYTTLTDANIGTVTGNGIVAGSNTLFLSAQEPVATGPTAVTASTRWRCRAARSMPSIPPRTRWS
ncbi:MAG: hypothetical protein WDO24_04750 [Pseudomonadota bacterium]